MKIKRKYQVYYLTKVEPNDVLIITGSKGFRRILSYILIRLAIWAHPKNGSYYVDTKSGRAID